MTTDELQKRLDESPAFQKSVGEHLESFLLLGFDYTGSFVYTRSAVTEKDNMALGAAVADMKRILEEESEQGIIDDFMGKQGDGLGK